MTSTDHNPLSKRYQHVEHLLVDPLVLLVQFHGKTKRSSDLTQSPRSHTRDSPEEHQLPFLFPFKDLDLGDLATGYCLLRLPRIKEILGKRVSGFKQSEAGTVPGFPLGLGLGLVTDPEDADIQQVTSRDFSS